MTFNYHRKIEKISQAIYLVSQHLKDNEPLKWEIRKEGIALLSCSNSSTNNFFSKDIPLGASDISLDILFSAGKSLISFLTLAQTINLIKEKNARIIIIEIESVLKSFENDAGENAAKSGFVLSEDFFNRLDKATDKKMEIELENNLDSLDIDANNFKEKKDGRREKILELLGKKSNLTVKDFMEVINDCSLKTIQRELTQLVKKGIVKKEGQRRWSNYSLK